MKKIIKTLNSDSIVAKITKFVCNHFTLSSSLAVILLSILIVLLIGPRDCGCGNGPTYFIPIVFAVIMDIFVIGALCNVFTEGDFDDEVKEYYNDSIKEDENADSI